MQPRTLSATSISVYEGCSARFKAEKIDWAPQPGSKFAGVGLVFHTAAQEFVEGGHHLDGSGVEVLITLAENCYYQHFNDSEHLEDVQNLCRRWHGRQSWAGRTVLSTEQKHHFMLPTPDGGQIKFNYVMDRVDVEDDGTIEVVDYKTGGLPMNHEALKHNTQARVYALAAQLVFPEAKEIRVTFDMIRHDSIGVIFTKEQNRDTYRYLLNLVKRIWEDDGTTETLNPECKWCVRKQTCSTLRRNINAGGVMTLTDPGEVADKRYDLVQAKAALSKMLDECDDFLLEYCERENITHLETDRTTLNVGLGGRRYVNPETVGDIIGPGLLKRHGQVTMGAVDDLLKGEDLTSEQKSALRQAISKNPNNPSIKTSKRKPDQE